jgi:hypothetical protein
MAILFVKNVPIAFPALAEAQAIGDGEPAFGGRFVIDPTNKALVAELDAAMLAEAKAKWKEDGEAVLAMLTEEGKVCFEKKPYRSKKTGKVYAGFEGKYNLGARTPANKPKPTVFDEYGKELSTKVDIERKVHSGAEVTAKVEIWAQDNSYGRRINCSLLGVMYQGEGEHFGGGSAPASADDFGGFAKKSADAESVL